MVEELEGGQDGGSGAEGARERGSWGTGISHALGRPLLITSSLKRGRGPKTGFSLLLRERGERTSSSFLS